MKKLILRLLAPRIQLDSRQAARLSAWHSLPEVNPNDAIDNSRFVVVDVETTGLNLVTDTLISIGAVSIVNGRIVLGDSFAVVLQQQEISRKENILVHGISGSAQQDGEQPIEALLTFLEYLGKDPLVAFHVTFDETMIARAIRQHLGFKFNHRWLDLAYVMPALYPDLMRKHRVLDDWTQCFSILNEDRHNAVADALATAQLMLIAVNRARNQQQVNIAGLRSLERNYRQANGLS